MSVAVCPHSLPLHTACSAPAVGAPCHPAVGGNRRRDRRRTPAAVWAVVVVVVGAVVLSAVPSVAGQASPDHQHQHLGRRVFIPPAGLTTTQRAQLIAKVKRDAAEARYNHWLELYRAQPQRTRHQVCDADGECVFKGVQVSLEEGRGMVFCVDCPGPHAEGSYLDTWEAWQHPEDFHVHGELVYGVPNDGSGPLLNTVGGAVVLLDRGGEVPFVKKILVAQDAGAAAVVIVDTSGECTEDFDCGRWLGSKARHYLAASDDKEPWRDVYIPAVLITLPQGRRLQALMDLTYIDVDDYGEQKYVPGVDKD